MAELLNLPIGTTIAQLKHLHPNRLLIAVAQLNFKSLAYQLLGGILIKRRGLELADQIKSMPPINTDFFIFSRMRVSTLASKS